MGSLPYLHRARHQRQARVVVRLAGGQTKMSWHSLLNLWCSRYLSGSRLRAVRFWDDPTWRI